MFNIKIRLDDKSRVFFEVELVGKLKAEYFANKVAKMMKDFELDNVEIIQGNEKTLLSAEADSYIAIGELGVLMLDIEDVLKSFSEHRELENANVEKAAENKVVVLK